MTGQNVSSKDNSHAMNTEMKREREREKEKEKKKFY